MSRNNHHHDAVPVHEAAAVWRHHCLERDGSIFDESKNLWTTDNLDKLDIHFVKNLASGEGNFYQKLKTQLSGGSPASQQLMAEIMWIHMLFSASILPATKSDGIRQIWSWSGETLAEKHSLFDNAVNGGLGATGPGFNNHRWRELVFLIGAFRALKAMDAQERTGILDDAWLFGEWLTGLADGTNRQMASILPHLLFPDSFERVSSKGHKWAVLSWFEGNPIREYKSWSPVDVDRALYDLRERLEKQAGREIDFYEGGEFSDWLNQPPALKNNVVKRWAAVLETEFSGFQRFDAPHAEFDEVETDYKIERTQRLHVAFETCEAPEDFAGAIHAAFSGYNMFNWRVLQALGSEWPKASLGQTVADFLECNGENPEEFVSAFVDSWMDACPDPQKDFARQIAGAVAMHLYPENSVYFRRTVLDKFYKEGMGQEFPRSDDMLEEYAEELRFSRAVEKSFTDIGLAPRNLMDVQSALWVIHNHKTKIQPKIEETTRPAIEDKAVPETLNTILYGPPGTGKTYRTAEEAVQICDGGVPKHPDAHECRKLIMARYHALCAENRVAFITFHQSYGYEEFVEGLRPMTDEGAEEKGGFRLEPVDGVLKTIAERARNSQASVPDTFDPQGRQVFKMSLGRYDAPEDDDLRQECFENGYILLGYGGEIDWSSSKFQTSQDIATHWRAQPGCKDASGSDPNIVQTLQIRVRMNVGDVVVVSHGNLKARAIGVVTGGYEYVPREDNGFPHRRRVEWRWIGDRGEGIDVADIYESRFSQQTIYKMQPQKVRWSGMLPYLEQRDDAAPRPPHVLIIDEINRANISKVLGELITLLEEDKREGAENALSVVLPHSKKPFMLPANLHILGTMNTADRSIALLDTALRRRFQFRSIDPDPSLLNSVEGIDLEAVLRSINARLEYLIGQDHLIGHAWLMKAKKITTLDRMMATKIIPLMREYFHEDLDLVRAVLGGGEAFLKRVALKPPPGLDNGHDEVRYQYVDQYEAEGKYGAAAYEELVNGVSPDGDKS